MTSYHAVVGRGGVKEGTKIGLICIGGTAHDIKDVLDMMKEGKLHIETSEVTFNEVPEGLDRLKEGKVSGRLVMTNK